MDLIDLIGEALEARKKSPFVAVRYGARLVLIAERELYLSRPDWKQFGWEPTGEALAMPFIPADMGNIQAPETIWIQLAKATRRVQGDLLP
jgi:hypothetical protein